MINGSEFAMHIISEGNLFLDQNETSTADDGADGFLLLLEQ